jgi:predicted TIM-barrel fold metal-dependent hydrolase
MVIDFEHHLQPYEIWKRRGGKPGQTVMMKAADGSLLRPLDDSTHDIRIHLKVMDAGGVDMAVLSGTQVDSLEEVKIFNNHFADIVRQYPGRFSAFATTLPLGGKEALSELERAIKDLGLKGVLISAQVEGYGLDDHKLWPFYGKVQELGVPIFVHPTVGTPGFDACRASYDLSRTIVREFDLALATTRICLGGVLEDFPELKFIIAHFGGGISSIKERLDRYVDRMQEKFWAGRPLISEPYAERFNEYFGKLYFNMAGREIGIGTIKSALTNISPGRLVFGTDYPPNFTDDPEGIRTYIEKIRELDMAEESIEAMLSTNGKALLGMA